MNVFAERRTRLLEQLQGVLVLPAAPELIRNNSVHHEYRQDSDFHYLTGFGEPDAVLVLAPKHPEHKVVLFVRKRDPEREKYDGARAGDPAAELLPKLLEAGITWRNAIEPSENSLASQWYVRGYPNLFLIDAKGVIRYHWIGSPGDDVLDKRIDELIAEAQAGKKD